MTESTFELRTPSDDEFVEWLRVVETGFGEHLSEVGVATERSVLPIDRTIAALDRDRIVGGVASFPFELTVPGGSTVRAAGVAEVAVAATHRRRGLLTAMLRRQFDDLVDRGEPVAVLNASEAMIYERFGYGVATSMQRFEIDPRLVTVTRPLPERPPLRIVPQADALELVAPAHDALCAARPGMVRRSEAWWRVVLGDHECWKGGGQFFVAVAEPFGTDPGGYAFYTMRDFGPDGGLHLSVRELVATTSDTEALLWNLLLTTDLVYGIEAWPVPVDAELRWWVSDPRAIRTTALRDYLWVRVLDVPAALAARRYGMDGAVVLEVVDRLGYAEGRFRLEVAHGVGSCEPVGDAVDPDVRLDVAALGSAYLGGVGLDTLARAGRVQAVSLEALATAAAMVAGDRAPFCDTRF